MNWCGAIKNGVDVTGLIVNVEQYDGELARVALNTGVTVIVPTTHEPVVGDAVVEGELSI